MSLSFSTRLWWTGDSEDWIDKFIDYATRIFIQFRKKKKLQCTLFPQFACNNDTATYKVKAKKKRKEKKLCYNQEPPDQCLVPRILVVPKDRVSTTVIFNKIRNGIWERGHSQDLNYLETSFNLSLLIDD